MKNLRLDIRIGNIIAILKPLFWLLLIEVLVFSIFALIPQGHDVYVYLLEEGFWTNAIPIFLLFISLIFLSCSSGLGGTMILALSNVDWNEKLSNDSVSSETKSNSDEGKEDYELHEKKQNYRRSHRRLIDFLWYFPYFSFLFGFYKVIITQKESGSPGFGNTAIFLTVLFSFAGLYFIFKTRKGIWAYIIKQMNVIHGDKGDEYLNLLVKPGKVERSQIGPNDKSLTLADFRPLVYVLCMFFTFSILLFIIFAFLPSNFYYFVGAAPLMVFGLAAWTNIYVAVNLTDKAYKIVPFGIGMNGKKYALSLKLLILIWVLFCSYINKDHPVNDIKISSPLKPTARLDSTLQTFTTTFDNKICSEKIPIIFVAVDGGASRTGLFGTMMLSVLQDSLPNFKNHIFAYSDISGGTLGANVFYALSRDGFETRINSDTCFTAQSRRFFKRDFLAPVIGTFLFGDALSYFWPGYIAKFDRGLALETEWQAAWKDIMPFLRNKTENAMQLGVKRMLEIDPKSQDFKPVMFINSHEVETGRRAIYSNVQMEGSDFSGIRNLNDRIKTDLPFSSAILFSARFPLISPSVALEFDGVKRHYVDGGYFESSGTLTLYEELLNLEDELKSEKYDVFVIHIDGGEDIVEADDPGISLLNEPLDIITGAIADRSGHTEFAVENLKNYVTRHYTPSHFITLKVGSTIKSVPVNWVLSSGAINQVIKKCREMLVTPQLSVLTNVIHTCAVKSQQPQSKPLKPNAP